MLDPQALPPSGGRDFQRDVLLRRGPLFGTSDFTSLPGSMPERDAVRFRDRTSVSILLRTPYPDLSLFNSLVMALRNCTKTDLLVGIRLYHGPLPGDPVTPVSLSGGRELLPPGDWAELRFPTECLGTYGSPFDWAQVDAVEITVKREKFQSEPRLIDILVRSLDGEHREIPRGPNFTTRGLEAVIRQEETNPCPANGYLGGERILPAGLRARVDPRRFRWPRPAESWSPYLATEVGILVPPFHWYPVESPADTLQGRIMGQALSMDTLWDADPHHAQEWRHFLHRHHFFRQLVLGLARTGDQSYAQVLDRLLESWIAAHPVPVGSNGGSNPAWETLSAAWRLREWLWVAATAWPSAAFRDSTVIEMACSIWEHTRHLMDHKGHPTNWIIVESSALALTGMCFPQFQEAPDWIEAGVELLRTHFQRQFFSDGAHFEISPLYHAICIHSYLEVRRAARAKGIDLPDEFHTRLEKSVEYLAALCRPDFTWVSFNDSRGVDSDFTALLRLAAEEFARADFLWIGTRGQQGSPRTRHLCVFRDAGISVMRSGPDSDASFLAFRAGRAGAGHVHLDAPGLDFVARGVSRLVDPGITTYEPDMLTEYYRSAASHNTILVDGKGPGRIAAPNANAPTETALEFLSGPDLDLVSGAYAWDSEAGSLKVRRTVAFVRPDYWIVHDWVSGRGTHEITVCWQFFPGRVEVDLETLVARCVDIRGPRFEIVPLQGGLDMQVEYSAGLLNPPRGWVSLGGADYPAPNVRYSIAAELPIQIAWLLLPYAGRPVSGCQGGST